MNFQKERSTCGLGIMLLGGFVVYVKGQALPDTAIKGRKARTLLKLIAHQRQYLIERARVTGILWPDLDPDAANAQLYKALHHIRKAFGSYHEEGEEWIEITDDLIRLAPSEGLVTDVALFENSARSGLKDRKLSELESALSSYSGDFLPMDRHAKWASFPREHYRQLYLDVITRLAVVYEERKELPEATQMWRLALNKQPTLEAAHRGLMRVFAKKGQATRAFHQYEACRGVLREELGLGPSTGTIKTLDDIREGKLRNRPRPNTNQTTVSLPTKPLIGRTEACTFIDRHLQNLTGGQGGAIFITGEAGIGKTRMVQELVRSTRQKELSFFGGSAIENVAYGAFIELFMDALSKRPGMENKLPVELGRLVPGFSGKGYLPPHGDKLLAKAHLFAQVHRFFSNLASDTPAVIVLEDMQSADQGSESLLSYLIRHRGRLPILFVATLRNEEGASLPSSILDRSDEVSEIFELEPLTYEEHVQLLHLHAENVDTALEMASYIFQLSEGNPLYALELLSHYGGNKDAASPQLRRDGGSPPTTSVSGRVPAPIFQRVEQKLERLSPPARHLLYIAAVIGRNVSYGLLESIWTSGNNNAADGLFKALEEVVRASLLEEHGLDYSFCHAMVHETIYSSISEARKRILHRQITEHLLEFSKDRDQAPVELIAWHYSGARDLMEAANYLNLAGERAENVYAYENALQRYREALNVLNGMGTGHAKNLKREILERIGDVYRASGQLDRCYDAYEKAISHTGGNLELMELHRKMAVATIFRKEIDRSQGHLERAFELAGENPRYRARLFITKSHHMWHLGRLEEAYGMAKKALGQARKAKTGAEASQACEMLAMTCLSLGRWEEGLLYENERQTFEGSPEIMVATGIATFDWT